MDIYFNQIIFLYGHIGMLKGDKKMLAFIKNQLLKMDWLWKLVESLVTNVFRLDMNDKWGISLHFFIYDTLKIFILLISMIFIISYIQSYFPPEKTKKLLKNMKGLKGNIFGALMGILTPFCSCSSIPIFIGFLSAGLPLGATFSFLIASPMIDLAALMLLISAFGIKVGILYVSLGVIIAVFSGIIISKMKLEKYVKPYVYNVASKDVAQIKLSTKDRFDYSISQVKSIFFKVWPYIIVGVGIGALIHNWIPQSLVEKVLGKNNPFSVLIATFIGIPMYADIFGTIPIAEALVAKSVGIGTVIAFMMGVTTMSVPSLVMLSNVIEKKLLITFVAIVSIGILIVGYGLNFAYPFILI